MQFTEIDLCMPICAKKLLRKRNFKTCTNQKVWFK